MSNRFLLKPEKSKKNSREKSLHCCETCNLLLCIIRCHDERVEGKKKSKLRLKFYKNF